jgi:DNA-binding NarL/FixJ family response regulator
MPIRVLVVDDHPLLRQGVILALQQQEDIEVVGEGESGQAAVELAMRLQPDIALLDISMPDLNGLEAAHRVRTVSPRTKIAMLTASEQGNDLITAMQAGAQGYILKGSKITEVVAAIKAIESGETYVSPKLAGKILLELSAPQPKQPDLSDREMEILLLVAQGLSNKEIAVELDRAEKTVKHHMTSLMRKIDVRSRVEAALYAHKQGLI